MKTTLFFCLALVAVIPVRAEIFRSEAARSSHRSERHQDRDHGRTTLHVGIGGGHGHHHRNDRHDRWYGRGYVHSPYRYVPSYGYYSGYGYGYPYYTDYGYRTGSGAANGVLLGALAGGVIGHNSGDLRHSAWRGAAWGAGLGWLLGSVADANRRPVAYETAPVVQSAAAPQAVPAPAAQPQQVTIINNYYNSSPMSSANGLFGR